MNPVRTNSPLVDQIRDWLRVHVAHVTGAAPEAIDVHEDLRHYGIDSASAVELVADLEGWLGRELPANLAWDFPSIEELASHLAE